MMSLLDRRTFIKTSAIATILALSGKTSASHGPNHNTPNIIFILTDDQRADTLGCMGNRIVETPNIDALAAEGTLFENASVTSAICTPSRASYFTGLYERCHGINFNSGTALSPAAWQNSYPMLLKKAGYFTGYVGKNHTPVGHVGYKTGLMDSSFDYWYAGHTHLLFYLKERPDWAIRVEGIDEHMFDNAKADTQVEILEEGAMNLLDPNEKFYHNASRFLEKRPQDRPFCLSVCFNLPHDAGTSNMESRPEDPAIYKMAYRDKAEQIKKSLPSTYTAKKDIIHPKVPSDVLIAKNRQHGYDYVDNPDTLVERIIRRYQSITGIDRFVGHLREKLKKLDLADNTIILFASDHGIMRGEFGLGGKALNYEPCLSIPFIVYDPQAPGDARGQRRKELVQSIDVAPTLLDYAGSDIPENMQGTSVVPLVRGQKMKWRKYAFAENLWSTLFGNPRIESVRSDEWKYIRYFKNGQSLFDGKLEGKARYLVSDKQAQSYKEWLTASIEGEQPVYEELFNLKNDPDEINNLAGDSQYFEILDKYREVCQNMVKQAHGKTQPRTLELLQKRLDFYLENNKQ